VSSLLSAVPVGAQTAPAAAPAVVPTIEFVAVVGHDKGMVRCGLYTRDKWLKKPFKPAKSVIVNKRAVCRFTGIASGTYAIAAYHDENANGKLDRNFIGIPSEPYGMTNDARPVVFAAPTFDAAKFVYQGGTVQQRVRLR
jgi:uncharacterized protein (DUF2141 family)